VQRPARTEDDKAQLVFHLGRIATGNAVIQDSELRDQIKVRCDGALCIEMAAGVDANRRCLVIRGISDYADSHKSDVWRSHAAGKAAAFARELLCRVPSSSDLPLVRNTVSGHGTIQRCLAVVIDWPMQY
jgi:nucleoside phosphorylase